MPVTPQISARNPRSAAVIRSIWPTKRLDTSWHDQRQSSLKMSADDATEEDRLMGVKVSGGSFSVLRIGINWARTPGDERIARAVIIFLEDRRLLFGSRHIETKLTAFYQHWNVGRFSPSRSLRPNPESRWRRHSSQCGPLSGSLSNAAAHTGATSSTTVP